MPITVYGAGAIGGITGAALARAGHDVLLVDSYIPHVEAINAAGLSVERDGIVSTTAVRAVTPATLGGGLSLVLLAVKSHHTAEALCDLGPRLAPTGTVVSLQNGLQAHPDECVVPASDAQPPGDGPGIGPSAFRVLLSQRLVLAKRRRPAEGAARLM